MMPLILAAISLSLPHALLGQGPPPTPEVSVIAKDAIAQEPGWLDNGVFTVSRSGSTASVLSVDFMVSGDAKRGEDYVLDIPGTSVTLPAGIAIPRGVARAWGDPSNLRVHCVPNWFTSFVRVV